MARVVCILEDDERRRDAMKLALAAADIDAHVATFATASEIMNFIKSNRHVIALLSLDHDLVPVQNTDGGSVDSGTGRDVTTFLLSYKPFAPVIIHSSNSMAAIGMEACLQEGGWSVCRLAPYGDLAWVTEIWILSAKDTLAE